MRSTRFRSLTPALLIAAATLPVARPAALSAQPTPGPVIFSGGAVFDVPSPTFMTPINHEYKVIFEIHEGVAAPAGGVTAPPSGPNAQLNTVARFLNMHVRNGVDRKNVHLAAVVHGTAGKDLLDNATYRERFGTDNPSAALIKELVDAGVRIVLCGQTAAGRDIPTNHLLPGVQFALSAMTVMNVLQSEGYTLNPW